MGLGDRQHRHLSRTEPKRPFASSMLNQDGHHALNGPQHSTVNDDGRVSFAISAIVLELEVDRQLEVQLDRATLMLALQRVRHDDVNLWAVEGAVAFIGPNCVRW
ncbi:hypothetical protein DVH05_011096 [Phytophthora capsici]|nr:hypothetical protein DVH05_011085 [Phytophthora capsici]KAG1684479.1 hypothetical protein DVH05_011088 [Phytophthora capsici]KAG1684487.1 hypothetical protein DVH05_011096 [Phytophthora capsici]